MKNKFEIKFEIKKEPEEDNFPEIKSNVEKLLKELNDLPGDIKLLAATKDRNTFQMNAALEAGVKIVGENYVNEAEEKFKVLGKKFEWHLIGHLQSNKVKEAVKIFDMIETLDSEKLARRLNEECKKSGKIMPVLIEVNSANEAQKHGLSPNRVEDFLKEILKFDNLKPMGLMTMGPFTSNSEEIRPFFRKTKEIFNKIKGDYSDKLPWIYLSMGMSDTYKIALEEGSNIIRIGTGIFGPRTNNQIRR